MPQSDLQEQTSHSPDEFAPNTHQALADVQESERNGALSEGDPRAGQMRTELSENTSSDIVTGQKTATQAADQSEKLAPDVVKLKGRANGVMIEIGAGAWPNILAALDKRLQSAVGFFRGGQVALDVSTRSLTEEELGQLRDILAKYALTLGAVRSESQRTFDAALQMGLASTLSTHDNAREAEAKHALSDEEHNDYFVYRGHLRSGQILAREETIILIGDVNPGARVTSGGDIYVWGRLRGVAHAGAQSDSQAIIAALVLDDAIQLRIGESVAIAPEQKQERKGLRFWQRDSPSGLKGGGPQVAVVRNGRIMVGSWQELKPGSPVPPRP